MNSKINLDEKSFLMVRDILKKNLNGISTKTYVFGSRVKGENRKFSDIDIAIRADNDIPFSIMARLNHDFEESNLDYFVNIVDLNTASERFVKCIENDLVEIFQNISSENEK